MTKELLKRIEALEAQGGCDIVFKFMDGEQEQKASFKEFIAMKKPAHWETLPNGARVWHTGFPEFRVCGGNNTKQFYELIDKIFEDITGNGKEVMF